MVRRVPHRRSTERVDPRTSSGSARRVHATSSPTPGFRNPGSLPVALQDDDAGPLHAPGSARSRSEDARRRLTPRSSSEISGVAGGAQIVRSAVGGSITGCSGTGFSVCLQPHRPHPSHMGVTQITLLTDGGTRRARRCSPGRSRTFVASPDSKSGGPCRQTNRGMCPSLGLPSRDVMRPGRPNLPSPMRSRLGLPIFTEPPHASGTSLMLPEGDEPASVSCRDGGNHRPARRSSRPRASPSTTERSRR